MSREGREIAEGALAGGLATVPMSALMVLAQRAGWIRRQPPEKITTALLQAVGVHDADDSTRLALSAVNHFAFGTTCGALFSLLHEKLRLPVAASTQGVFFGMLVWLVSYEGWVPAVGIMAPVEHDRPGQPAAMLAAHVLYGAALGGVVGALSRR